MKRWFVSGFKGAINRSDLESPSAPGRLLCCEILTSHRFGGAAGKRRRVFPSTLAQTARVSIPRPRHRPLVGRDGARPVFLPLVLPVWELPRSQRVTALGPGEAPTLTFLRTPAEAGASGSWISALSVLSPTPETPCCTLPASGCQHLCSVLTGVLGKEMPNAFHKLPG